MSINRLHLYVEASVSCDLSADIRLCDRRPQRAAAEETAAAEPAPAPAAPPQGSKKEFKTFNERDFVLEVPRSYKEVQDPASSEFGEGGRPKSTYGTFWHALV